jgi:hypothetical protein
VARGSQEEEEAEDGSEVLLKGAMCRRFCRRKCLIPCAIKGVSGKINI